MRIVGGAWRGRGLQGLGKGDPAAALRPTSDRVRESLFNLLAHGAAGDPVPGARVLDAFAGTGALGLEALSRGATRATFLDTGRAAQRLIAANIARTGASDLCTVLKRDATRPGPPPHPHDLVFLDPPYGRGLGDTAFAALRSQGWLAPGAIIVWEEADTPAAPPQIPPETTLLDRRLYGGTAITILAAP